MEKRIDFTSGRIVGPLLKFAGPVLLALFLQAMYGAVDLLIVGKFASSADVSAVSTGSQIMMTITNILSSLCMGMTILLGQKIGEKRAEEGGRIVGSGLVMFLTVGIVLSFVLPFLAPQLAGIMHAPEAAYDLTVQYIRICGGGAVVIIAYNLIGGIFRGLGDSNTPLVTVLIACIFNIAGDLTLVAGFHMGTAGAEGVRSGLPADVLSFLLHRLLQWNGKDVLRHDAGHPWCIRGARSGFISHEQADARFAVPYRAGNTLFNRCADHAVLYLSVASAPPRQSDIRQKLSVRVSRLAGSVHQLARMAEPA